MSRLEKSFKNIILTFGNTAVSAILGFIARTVFIHFLGEQYLGLSGLLSNVLGFLSITEIGLASAIGFSLYKPLAEKDYESASALMSLYRKAYAIIGTIVAVSGIGLFFFLDFFISPSQQPAGTDIAYFAYLFNTVLGYFFTYKTTLLSSDNQAYRIVPINMAFSLGQTILQIVALLIFKSYLAYLTVQIICSGLLMVVQNRYITRLYPQVNFYTKQPIQPEQATVIKRNIGGLIIAKIGDYLVNSTDNLIITKCVSLSATGLYSNYLLIRNIVNGFISTLFGGITASMGNIVAVESDEKKLSTFNTILFFAYFIYSFEAVCFLCLFNPFIGDIWIGREFLFDTFTVAIIVVNNFLTGLRIPLITMKSAAGTYMEDAWIPFGFAGVNLVASIILAKYMGVAGVFLGTIIGSLCTADWYRPIIMYRKVFHAPVSQYFRKYLMYVFLGFVLMAASCFVCSKIDTGFLIVDFIIKCFIAVALPLVVNSLLFWRSADFKQLVSIGQRLFQGLVRRLNKSKR